MPADAVEVSVEWRHASVLVERSTFDDTHVAAGRRGSDLLEVRRDPPAVRLDFVEPTGADAVVHPMLTAPLSVLARWRGDITLHAGAFLSGEAAWAVMGEREAGKSTALAKVAEHGCPLLADDLLVIDDGWVRAGPACIDLRPDVARHFKAARFLGEVGGRPRHRLDTDPGPARAKLGGIFLLGWSEDDSIEVHPVDPAEALRVLYAQEYISLLGPADPDKILSMLGLPMWRLSRPRDWSRADETAAKMIDTAAGAAQ